MAWDDELSEDEKRAVYGRYIDAQNPDVDDPLGRLAVAIHAECIAQEHDFLKVGAPRFGRRAQVAYGRFLAAREIMDLSMRALLVKDEAEAR